jgi:putative membrane protein
MGLGMIGMALFWILIILATVALVKGMWGSRVSAGHGQEETALDALKKRYARGEVDKEEFEQKKRDLAS